MTTQIEAFEEFYGNYQKPLVPDALAKNANGEYRHYFTRDALAIWNAALSQPNEPVGLNIALIKIKYLPRFTFLSPKEGGVRKYADDSGNWIEYYEAIKILDDLIYETPSAPPNLEAKIAELEAENKNLRTVMMAAAVEITEHWDAHCDAEGYGCTNLVRRLENGYPEQYGYDANTMVNMDKQIAELTAKCEKMREALEKVAYMGTDNAMGSDREYFMQRQLGHCIGIASEALEGV